MRTPQSAIDNWTGSVMSADWQLLIKYIRHVNESEGVTFISDWRKGDALEIMTEAQWDRLIEAEKEAEREDEDQP